MLECARACLQPGSHVLTREDLPAVLDAVIHDERVLAALMHMESFTTAMLLLQVGPRVQGFEGLSLEA